MIKFEDYNIICNNFDNLLEYAKEFYLNSSELNKNCVYDMAICNHGHMFYNKHSDLIIRPYNINIIPAFGCNLLDNFKLCFIEDEQVYEAGRLFQELRTSKLHRVINVITELKSDNFKMYLDEIESESNKIPSEIDSYDISYNIYKHNKRKLNKLNVCSITQTKQFIVDKLFSKYPMWTPTYKIAKQYLNKNSKYYIANLNYSFDNIDLISSDSRIIGIICSPHTEDGIQWIKNKIVDILHGTGAEI